MYHTSFTTDNGMEFCLTSPNAASALAVFRILSAHHEVTTVHTYHFCGRHVAWYTVINDMDHAIGIDDLFLRTAEGGQ